MNNPADADALAAGGSVHHPAASLGGAGACVLVVDDHAPNLQIVAGVLGKTGHRVLLADTGEQALALMESDPPDLVLLDLMMPVLDGLEVCRRLKAAPAHADVPVIFLTASSELTHLVQAFEVGAADYVTKPFNAPELLARVRTHLELRRARLRLQELAARLQAMNEEKSRLMSMAAHDLRNPLTAVVSYVSLLRGDPEPDRAERLRYLAGMEQAAQRMLQLLRSLLHADAIESGRWKPERRRLSLTGVVERAIRECAHLAAAKQQQVHGSQVGGPFVILGDENAVLQIVVNLLSNAIKFSPLAGRIDVRLEADAQHVRLEVQDTGPGLQPEDHAQLFTKFARLSARPTAGEASTGLGLSIVKHLVDCLQGRITVQSVPGAGATFRVEWPAPN